MAKLKSTQISGTLQVTGEILNKATTTTQGVVQLNDAVNSTSTTQAATANAVKKAYDLANGKANASHGNHVPTVETANNARFLRNDNTWQTITAGNIGALATGGTAVAASKLATARTIALTGGITGSGTFDGSGNLSIATTIAGNAPTASKLAIARTIALGNQLTGSASFDGSGNVTINASINYIIINSGDLNTYTKDGWYRCTSMGTSNSVTNKPINTTDAINGFSLHVQRLRNVSDADATVKQTFSWGSRVWERLGTMGTTTSWSSWREIAFTDSNVASASKLATARTITLGGSLSGSGTFDGSSNITISASITGNAPTASKLATARTIALTGGATGSGTFDGSGNLSIATTVSWGNISGKPTIPGIIIGTGKFTADGTTTITIGKTLTVANYHVTVTPIGNPNGSLGEVYVTDKTTTTFKVGTTGSTTGSFEYLITYIA